MDIMTPRLNQKQDTSKDPLPLTMHAPVIAWSIFRLVYAFPPVRILPQLCKIKEEWISVILTALNWPRRAWCTDYW